MAQTSLETVSQGQAAQPAKSVSPPKDDDPQTLRQQQHESAESTGQADLQVRFADVGCGFGGLLVRLSPMYPDTLMVGMEIRDKVSHAPDLCSIFIRQRCLKSILGSRKCNTDFVTLQQ